MNKAFLGILSLAFGAATFAAVLVVINQTPTANAETTVVPYAVPALELAPSIVEPVVEPVIELTPVVIAIPAQTAQTVPTTPAAFAPEWASEGALQRPVLEQGHAVRSAATSHPDTTETYRGRRGSTTYGYAECIGLNCH